MDTITFGQLLTLLDRISTSVDDPELTELRELIRQEIGGSHCGCAIDEVVIQRSDSNPPPDEDDDGERTACEECGESFNANESDAQSFDDFCSRACERKAEAYEDEREEPEP